MAHRAQRGVVALPLRGARCCWRSAPNKTPPTTHLLGADIVAGEHPQFVVPPGHWQRARPRDDQPCLVSCVVVPGFDFADFALGRVYRLSNCTAADTRRRCPRRSNHRAAVGCPPSRFGSALLELRRVRVAANNFRRARAAGSAPATPPPSPEPSRSSAVATSASGPSSIITRRQCGAMSEAAHDCAASAWKMPTSTPSPRPSRSFGKFGAGFVPVH